MQARTEALTDKENQTLRLIARGHDAKSCARDLGLSVHTINERLREARRKLGVSSSREAARLLLSAEEPVPQSSADKLFGEAMPPAAAAGLVTPRGRSASGSHLVVKAGGTIMLLSLAALALSLTAKPQDSAAGRTTGSPAIAQPAQSEATSSALRWLALVDRQDWQASWSATGSTFRQSNTLEVWRSASEAGRVPLGAVLRRTATSEESVPAPPNGYQMVKFRTAFTNRGEVTETLSLVREGEEWRVVGYIIG